MFDSENLLLLAISSDYDDVVKAILTTPGIDVTGSGSPGMCQRINKRRPVLLTIPVLSLINWNPS